MSALLIYDPLEALFAEKTLECNSRMEHFCAIEAHYATLSKCNGETRYWCVNRYKLWREHHKDYSRVCSDCLESIPRCWVVRPI